MTVPRPPTVGESAPISPRVGTLVVALALVIAGCGPAGGNAGESAASATAPGEGYGEGSPTAGLPPGTGSSSSVAPADPIACVLDAPSLSPDWSPGASFEGPPQPPPGPPGAPPPDGIPPPPPVPPEALAELNRLAGFASDLDSPITAGDDGHGVIYIGEKGVERIGSYMDRVQDNLDWFWHSVLDQAGKSCAWELPERHWIAGDAYALGPCQKGTDSSTAAYYCGHAGASGTAGAIVVRERWMFFDVYQKFGDHAEFAVASVLAHETGHHMQDVLGLLRDSSPRRCCGLRPLNIELHADCLGGVWAHSIYGRREIDLSTMTQAVRAAEDFADTPGPGDTGERGHGTAEERRQWYLAGFETGEVSACEGALSVKP